MIIDFHENCTGCGACVSICPEKCIYYTQNEAGFYYPKVSQENCKKCQKCINICPNQKKISSSLKLAQYYCGWCKDEYKRNHGTSGGLVGLLSEWTYNHQGIIFGASFSDNYRRVLHINSEKKGIRPLLKSKYVESFMGNIIDEVLLNAKLGRHVLFCGTPCEVMGVRSILKDNFPNVVLVDFVCHGVPSVNFYNKYLDSIEKKYDSSIKQVQFRSEKYGWKTYCMEILLNNGKNYCKLGIEDPYYYCFLRSIGLRKTCYNCNRMIESQADITLGDFWEYYKKKEVHDDDKGISLIITRTKKGENMLANISELLELFKLRYSDVEYIFEKRSISENVVDASYANLFADSPKIDIVLLLKAFLLKNQLFRKFVYYVINKRSQNIHKK